MTESAETVRPDAALTMGLIGSSTKEKAHGTHAALVESAPGGWVPDWPSGRRTFHRFSAPERLAPMQGHAARAAMPSWTQAYSCAGNWNHRGWINLACCRRWTHHEQMGKSRHDLCYRLDTPRYERSTGLQRSEEDDPRSLARLRGPERSARARKAPADVAS